MGNSNPDVPDPVESYRQGIEIYLASLPRMLRAEADARMLYDPQRIQQQQDLQDTFGERQYRQQLEALNQLDPESRLIRGQVAERLSSDLASGYDLPEDYERELETNIRGAQAARGNSLSTAASGAESAFKGEAALRLYQQRLANAGTFLSSPTPTQQISLIQGVQPDRTSAYANPNAGYQGINMAQLNYQNLLAQGAQPNPWANALGGAASGASAGASVGGGWGALIGSVAGGAAGYFCDSRLKENITEIGTSPSGIPLIEFNYKSDPSKRRCRAARAEDVRKVFPDAVSTDPSGYLLVNFALTDIQFCQL